MLFVNPVSIFSEMARKSLPETKKKKPLAAKVDPAAIEFLMELAREDRRTLSFMVDVALREFMRSPAKARAAMKR